MTVDKIIVKLSFYEEDLLAVAETLFVAGQLPRTDIIATVGATNVYVPPWTIGSLKIEVEMTVRNQIKMS